MKTPPIETDASSSSEPKLTAWIRRLVAEVREQVRTSAPTMLSMVIYKFPWLISLRFVGAIGAEELAAAALATTLFNVMGLSLSLGLSSALTTLTGQARGDLRGRLEEKNQNNENGQELCSERTSLLSQNMAKVANGSTFPDQMPSTANASHDMPLLPLVYLYRGLLVQFMFVLPIGCWWTIGIKPLLLALGQSRNLSTMTEDYLRILTPGLFSYSINWTLTTWSQAIEMAEIPAFGAFVGLLLHIPFNLFFVYTLGMGYLGCAVATVLFQIVQPLIIVVYIYILPSGRRHTLNQLAAVAVGRNTLSVWKEAKIAATSLSGIVQYLGLAVPGIIIVSEWWASETCVILSGRLTPFPDLALGAMAMYQSLNTFCFMGPVACSVAGATRVGNLLGAGKSEEAAYASGVCVLCAALVGALMASTLFFTPHWFFPSLFAPSEDDLIEETSHTITLLSVYVFADSIQAAFSGTIKGCGRQAVTMPIVVIAYWIVGLPLAYYFAFIKNAGDMCDDNFFCGDVGLVAGMTVGTWVHMLLLGVVVLFSTNWEVEAKRAEDRLDAQRRHHPPLVVVRPEALNDLEAISP